jgi:hypothetical protein
MNAWNIQSAYIARQGIHINRINAKKRRQISVGDSQLVIVQNQ